MYTILKLATVLALVVTGQVMAQSLIDYTLELGGDNFRADYKSGLWPVYDPGSTDNGQQYNMGDIINWAVRVEVSGIHATDPTGGLGDGLPVAGGANLVFSLKVTDEFAGEVLLSAGSATEQGWYSSIMDGTERTGFGVDPIQNAAFPTVFDVGTNGAQGGTLYHPYASGGPHMEVYSYPSADGRRASGLQGSASPVITDGSLRGMGAGYLEFLPYPYGEETGGVGLAADVTDVCDALVGSPVFEGQINTAGMAPGVYTLELIEEEGNNVLWGEYYACTYGYNDTFAVAANQVSGDTITFEILPECTVDADCDDADLCTIDACVSGVCENTAVVCPEGQFCDPSTGNCVECLANEDCPTGEVCDTSTGFCVECLVDADCPEGEVCDLETNLCVPEEPCTEPLVTGAVSRKTQGATPYDIDVLAGARECRANGVTTLVVTFNQDVAAVGSPVVSLTSGSASNVDISGSVVTITMSGGVLHSTLGVSFPGLADAVTGLCPVNGTVNALVKLGDATNDGNVNIFDLVVVRDNSGQAVTGSNFRSDVTADGSINIFDMVLIRDNSGL